MTDEADPSTGLKILRGASLDDILPEITDWFPEPSRMPLILDTDIGGEPDDALALAIPAGLPNLVLVITSDEYGGRRARLARYLLDLLGRTDVPVVAGSDHGNESPWAAEDLVPSDVPGQPSDVIAAVEAVCQQHDGKISWIGLGPMSNLATALAADPGLSDRLTITQQEAAIRYSSEGGQRNIGLDLAAARKVLATGIGPWIVPADITFQVVNELDKDSSEYRVLNEISDPARVLLSDHIDQWLREFTPTVTLHGLMTLALGVGMPYLASTSTNINLDQYGQIEPGDKPANIVRTADYRLLRRWFVDRLAKVQSTLAHHPAASAENEQTAESYGGTPSSSRSNIGPGSGKSDTTPGGD